MNGAFSNAYILWLSTAFYSVLDFAGGKFLILFKRVVLVTVRDNTTILINWWQSRKEKIWIENEFQIFLKKGSEQVQTSLSVTEIETGSPN